MNEMLSLKSREFWKAQADQHKLLVDFPGCLLIQLANDWKYLMWEHMFSGNNNIIMPPLNIAT